MSLRQRAPGRVAMTIGVAMTVFACALSGCASAAPARVRSAPGTVPQFDHVVVVVEENHSYSDIIGNSSAPYLNSLAQQGVSFTDSHAITHPSQPNYLALFSGSTQGVTSDSCPRTFAADNLGHQVGSFAGYSEGLPSTGYSGCTSGSYARKHNPWSDFTDVPATQNLPFTAFPADYAQLPKLSFVIPDLDDDMHDGSVGQGDSWLRDHLSAYQQWASAHNSLLIVTWDEDDNSAGNQIPTIFTGAHVKPGQSATTINHSSVLHTLETSFGLGPLGSAASAPVISDVWN